MTLVIVMAKAPVAGQVKTRLCPPLSPEDAARLARAFLADTIDAAARVSGARVLVATAGDPMAFGDTLSGRETFEQHGSDLGARIGAVVATGLARADRVVVIGSDLPGLPPAHLDSAAALLDDADVCLGPSADGGFYLIAARRWHSGVLAGVPWSALDTRSAAIVALEGAGLAVALAPVFDDIDEPADLERLRAALAREPELAPATAAALASLET